MTYEPEVCNLCGGPVFLVANELVYGRRVGSGFCYVCQSCGARVGTHKNSPTKALGILADAEMRRLKVECHALFDKTWSTSKERSYRYERLAGRLGIPVSQCHFGFFDKAQLTQAKEILNEKD